MITRLGEYTIQVKAKNRALIALIPEFQIVIEEFQVKSKQSAVAVGGELIKNEKWTTDMKRATVFCNKLCAKQIRTLEFFFFLCVLGYFLAHLAVIN